MTALVGTILINKTLHTDIPILQMHIFFLDEIKRHFMDSHAGYKIWRAFRYLTRYFQTYPQMKIKRVRIALKMAGLIYESLGFERERIVFRVGEKNE